MLGYVLLAIPAGLTVIFGGQVAYHKCRGRNLCLDPIVPLTWFCGVVFSAFALLGFLNHIGIHATIAAHQETGATLDRARENDFEGFERATLQREVVASNREISELKVYYHYWRPFVPVEILNVEPIE